MAPSFDLPWRKSEDGSMEIVPYQSPSMGELMSGKASVVSYFLSLAAAVLPAALCFAAEFVVRDHPDALASRVARRPVDEVREAGVRERCELVVHEFGRGLPLL